MGESQFALRSELWKLMRISRSASPGSLYGASAAARTFAGVNMDIGNPTVPDESTGGNITRDARNLKFSHVKGISGFTTNKSNDGSKVIYSTRI